MLFTDDANDAFRPFWGLPDDVEEASFHQLRVAGAFLVSSRRAHGNTLFLAVRSTVAGSTTCTFYPPPDWASLELVLSPSSTGSTLQRSADRPGAWTLDGVTDECVVYPDGRVPTADDLTIRPASGGDSRFYNWWGYHPGGAGRRPTKS